MHRRTHKRDFLRSLIRFGAIPVLVVPEDSHCQKRTSCRDEHCAENECGRFKYGTYEAAYQQKHSNHDTNEISLVRFPHFLCYIFLTFMVINVIYF
jgi:hypothetical protein